MVWVMLMNVIFLETRHIVLDYDQDMTGMISYKVSQHMISDFYTPWSLNQHIYGLYMVDSHMIHTVDVI